MRAYPHKINEQHLISTLGELRRDLEIAESKYPDLPQMQKWSAPSSIITERCDLASLMYASEFKSEEVKSLLAGACRFIYEEINYLKKTDPFGYMKRLAISVISEDNVLRQELSGDARKELIEPSVADEAFYQAADGMADIAAGRLDTARTTVSALLAAGSTSLYILRPIAYLEEAIITKQSGKLNDAIALQHNRWNEMANNDQSLAPNWLLDILGLSFIKLAEEAGLNPTFQSVYLPTEVLKARIK